MAYVLKLQSGTVGAEVYIDFLSECSGDPWRQLDDGGLDIAHPKKKQVWASGGTWRQGKQLAQHAYENRIITIKFEIGGSDWDLVFDAITEINRWLEDARNFQYTKLTNKVYLKYQVDTTTDPIWFDVLDGDLVLPKDFMSVEKQNWVKCTNNVVMKDCVLALDCKPFGYGTIKTIPAGPSGTTIQNAYDGSNVNYVEIDGDDIKGDVPGPLSISYTRNYVPGDPYYVYWVGLRDTDANPANFVHVLEAKDADYIYAGSVAQGPDNAYSNQDALAWTNIAVSTGRRMLQWGFAAGASPLNYAGRLRALLVGQGLGNAGLWQLRTRWQLTTIREYPWRTDTSAVGFDVLDLGVIELPPWNVESRILADANAGSFDLVLYLQNDALASPTIDALYLFPANDYKFRRWSWRGYYASNGDMVYDDAETDQVTHEESDLYSVGIMDWRGLPIHITPGNDARLYFMVIDSSGDYDAQMAGDIFVHHRPYYLNIHRGTD